MSISGIIIMVQLLAKELTEFQIQDMRKKFMAVDRDGDGFIDANELVQGMQQVIITTTTSSLSLSYPYYYY